MNRKKVEEYSILLKDSAAILQADTELWKQFLHFATQFTHYRFRDQLLIYAQNQQATACATFAQWKKIGRYVRSGEHSIVLLDETGNRPRLRHIFDVTSTGPTQEFAYKPKPILLEEREELAKRLSTFYARENSLYAADAKRWDNNLEQTLSQVAMYMTTVYRWNRQWNSRTKRNFRHTMWQQQRVQCICCFQSMDSRRRQINLIFPA